MVAARPLPIPSDPAQRTEDEAFLLGLDALIEEDARRPGSPLSAERRARYGHDLDAELADYAAGRHPVQQR